MFEAFLTSLFSIFSRLFPNFQKKIELKMLNIYIITYLPFSEGQAVQSNKELVLLIDYCYVALRRCISITHGTVLILVLTVRL